MKSRKLLMLIKHVIKVRRPAGCGVSLLGYLKRGPGRRWCRTHRAGTTQRLSAGRHRAPTLCSSRSLQYHFKVLRGGTVEVTRRSLRGVPPVTLPTLPSFPTTARDCDWTTGHTTGHTTLTVTTFSRRTRHGDRPPPRERCTGAKCAVAVCRCVQHRWSCPATGTGSNSYPQGNLFVLLQQCACCRLLVHPLCV